MTKRNEQAQAHEASEYGEHIPTQAQVPAKVDTTKRIGLLTANPKKPGAKAHARFALYKEGMTVGEYQLACKGAGFSVRNATADIAWDVKHGFIKIG